MLHIARISSIAPMRKLSKDYLMTVIFSNGDVKTMVLSAAAYADLVKRLRPEKAPSSRAQPKKKTTTTKVPSKTT